MKSIVIAGANGFLGRVLSRHFLNKNWSVVGLARSAEGLVDGVDYVHWDGQTLGEWTESLEWVDVLVNLAGRTVNCRYTNAHKKEVLESRVGTTTLLGKALEQCKNPPSVWMNAATATIYRHAEDRPQDEHDGELGTGFSCDVAREWEGAFYEPALEGVRKVGLRTSLVLGDEKGTVWTVFQKLARLGLAGTMGSGTQMVSWISDVDFARSIEWFAENESASGSYNICAPNPVSNRELMAIVRRSVGKKCGLPASRWMLEIGTFFMRTETELVLKSRWVIPTRLLEEGFNFNDDDLVTWSQSAERED